jgi:hypothetical protein
MHTKEDSPVTAQMPQATVTGKKFTANSYLLGAVAFSSSARYLATQRMPFPHICNWHRKFKLSLNRSWKQSSRIQKLIETINKTLQCAQIKCTINQKNCDKMECHQRNRPGHTATQYDNMSTLSRSLSDWWIQPLCHPIPQQGPGSQIASKNCSKFEKQLTSGSLPSEL